MGGIQHTGI